MTATPTPPTADKPPRKKANWSKTLLIVLCVLLSILLVITATLYILIKTGEKKLRQNLLENDPLWEGMDVDEEAIYHDGKMYYYNDRLINLLLIGVDRSESSPGHKQADALYLLSVDADANIVRVVSISRNTLCDIHILDINGNAYGTEQKQICLSYAYGNSPESSAMNTVRATSNLLYHIPIHGYYALHMSTVKDLVDLVGGVTVTVPQDADADILLDKRGQTVRLNGDEAMSFLRTRGDSNGPRVTRQEQFIAAFKSAAAAQFKKDVSLPTKLLGKLSEDASTSIDLSGMLYLATEALNWRMEFFSVPGQYSMQDGFEIYTVDETALRTVLLDVFYTAS